ncbi:MAG: hypothetical protein H6920_09520 [Sphingomonadaceae bacterium]|nr:hypothetical protein [Sphingomonadaceae bacterium]MCP5383219.1 hypothetical protein [Altererythrobacter sp.]MCP5391845.1 hypothetical protein [Sphingomonadaceae bacterium]MCP5393396.1 hypothetical protein [Sphingomonadaceae bacterium]
MAFGLILTAALASQAAIPASDVAYEELSAQQNRAAIEKLEAQPVTEDPAKLINLGIAYAREGRHVQARAMFEQAARSENRVQLETATGEWVDSRWLAVRAIALLDEGEFGDTSRFAAR